MSTFALEEIKEIVGKIKFFYLKIDDINHFTEFEKQIEKDGTYESELNTIQSLMQQVSEMKFPLPKTKFKDVTPKNDPIKEYEIKTRNLRVLLFHQEKKGHIIVLPFKKTDQKKAFKKFRRIKSSYFS